MKYALKFFSLLLISFTLSAQTPEKLNATLNREELKKLRDMLRTRYKDTTMTDIDVVAITKDIDTAIASNKGSTTVNNVAIKDLLTIAEQYSQDFIDVETKKKGRNNFIRIMRMIRVQDPNLTSILNSDGYSNKARQYVPLILDILDKEKQ